MIILKKIIDSFNNLDRSIKRTIVGGFVVVFGLIIIVFILGSLNNKKMSYTKIEDKIKNAAITYYERYPEKLPQLDGGEVNLEVSTLIDAGLIKKIDNYIYDKCNANCNAYINYIFSYNGIPNDFYSNDTYISRRCNIYKCYI